VNVRGHWAGADFTSPAGKMTLDLIAAVAEFERDLLIERTQYCLARAKSLGESFGLPRSLDDTKINFFELQLSQGETVVPLEQEFFKASSRSCV
jgi:putative DNA-invertase from lambdoid prophage Rac